MNKTIYLYIFFGYLPKKDRTTCLLGNFALKNKLG